jgi:hypothetical protein
MEFPQAMDITQISNDTSADSHLRCTVAEDIWTACVTNLKTTSAITWTTVTEEQALIIFKELEQKGYTLVYGTGTVTVSWQ